MKTSLELHLTPFLIPDKTNIRHSSGTVINLGLASLLEQKKQSNIVDRFFVTKITIAAGKQIQFQNQCFSNRIPKDG